MASIAIGDTFASYEELEQKLNDPLQGSILGEERVEQDPTKIPHSCLNKNFNVQDIRSYFDGDAWKAIEHVYSIKKNSPKLYCIVCQRDLSEYASCMCDSCLCWQHLKCIGKRTRPKT